MKNLRRSFCAILCVVFTSFSSPVFSQGQQTLTQINGWNAYVHLPASYNSSTASYPTIIFFPGIGEIGTDPNKLISNGPGAYISQGWNGNVVVDGTTVEFIVISIQPPSGYPAEVLINDKIQKIKSLYRVDNNRLYLTGLSHGGWCASTFVTGDAYGGPYTYASQVAAVVEVQGVVPDDNSPYPNLFDNFAQSGGRLLGLEQKYDNRGMPTRVNRMNATKPNSAIYVQTMFGGGGHCCWNQYYGGQGVLPGNFELDGISQNIYQWMARQSRNGTPPVATNQAPVVNAGADISITLPTASTTLSGTATDADGSIASYKWTKISGNAATIANPASAQTNVSTLTEGVYEFELEAKDNAGAVGTDRVTVTVNAAPVLSPAVNPGNVVNGINYKYYEGGWAALPAYSTLSTVKTGSTANFDLSVANRADQFGFEFTGYISVPADGIYSFYLTSDDGSKLWIDNQLVVDHDGMHGAIEKQGNIGLKAGMHMITAHYFEQGGSQIFELRYSATGISKQIFPATSIFRPAPVVTNLPPTSIAGANQTVTTYSTELMGKGVDTDGTIAGYRWLQVSGPAPANILSPAAATTTVSGLKNGVYIFELTVTDNLGASGTSTLQVTVNIPGDPIPGGSANKTVRVNIYGGSNPYLNAEWNNWNIYNRNSSQFIYDDQNASTISASITGDLLAVDNGAGYAAPATTAPSDVLRYSAAATSYRDLSIKGLKPGGLYYIEVFASRKNNGNKTRVAIQNVADTIDTDYNSNDYAKFGNVVADANGIITINLSRIGVWNYISAFTIMEQSESFTGKTAYNHNEVAAVAKPTTAYGETITEASPAPGVSIYPNPFVGSFNVLLNDKLAGDYILKLSSLQGKIIFNKKITKPAGPRIEKLNAANLPAGNYILQIVSVTTGNSIVHKVVKH